MTRHTILRGALVLLLASIAAVLAMPKGGALHFTLVVAIFGRFFSVPLALAAGIIERPFVSRAGVPIFASTHSLRANLLSWLAVYTLILVLGPRTWGFMIDCGFLGYVYTHVPPFFVLSIPMSIFIEGRYYRRVLKRQGGTLRWRWVIAANLISSAVLIGTEFVPGFIVVSRRLAYAVPVRVWDAASETLAWLLLAVCLGMVAVALWPRNMRRHTASKANQAATESQTPPQEASPP